MLTKKQLKATAQKPIGRMKERLAGRIVNPCNLACFTCDRFLGHNHACPGVKARHPGSVAVANGGVTKRSRELPICHVDFRTGKMENPLDAITGELIPGQEEFYEIYAEDHRRGCSWVAVKRKNPPAMQGAY